MATRAYSVFISYASEDHPNAEALFLALRAAEIEAWLDKDQLRGGEAWDEQIRQRIRSCTFFLALVSPRTDAREEGYFRREWRMAIDRMNDLAEDRPFLIPLALEGTNSETARVPAKFREVQWLPLGADDASAQSLVRQLDRLHGAMDPLSSGWVRRGDARFEPTAGRLARRTTPRRNSLGIILSVLAGGAAALAAFFSFRAPPAAGLPLDPQGVSVQPFVNVSGSPNDDYLCDGLTEEVTDTLAKESALHVVARSSAASLSGKSPAEVGATLRVGTVVLGDFQRRGDEVLLHARAVSGASGAAEWSHEYRGAASTLIALETSLSEDTARVLAPHSTVSSSRPPLTSNLDAYDAFLHADSVRQKAPTEENIRREAAYYRQAVSADPRFALAWARYGILLIRLHNLGFDDSNATLQEAHRAVSQAMALRPDLPEAHEAMASYLGLHWADLPLAIEEYQKALAASPNDDDAWHGLAVGEQILGHKAEAVRAMEHAVALDPRNAGRLFEFGIILAFASRYDDAIATEERVFALDRSPDILLEEAWIERERSGNLALALAKVDAALAWCKTADDRNEYWRYRSNLLRSQERWSDALAAVDHLETDAVPTQFMYYTKPLLRAQIRESMDDPSGAQRDYATALELTRAYAAHQPEHIRSHLTLALLEAALNQPAAARADVAQCLQLVPPEQNPFLAALTSQLVQIQVEYRLGARDHALQLLTEVIAAGFYKRNDLLLAPEWEKLRGDPQFHALAESAPL
ncbi:MAG TPA: TIR domain-containing protein [Opitutaceae bacterium]|jgi:TolB-like protein